MREGKEKQGAAERKGREHWWQKLSLRKLGGMEGEESRKVLATEDFVIEQLLDPSVAIGDRFRALFTLRNLRGPKPRQALIKAMRDKSNLLAHEAAFALGQMQDLDAIPALKDALEDISSLHPIVRHEAAEALGAMGNADCLNILKRSLEVDPAREVRETCELALQRLQHHNTLTTGMHERSPFLSVDPAAPASSDCTTHDLRVALLDEERDMYERYAALFALRNRGGSEAIQAIIAALKAESALLKHEVAYVLGQIQDKATANALAAVLQDTHEHPMVRHEAAEALGSIADSGSVALLKQFQGDEEPIVSQSCEVAIRMLEFERNGKTFEYLYLEAPSITTS